MINLKKKPTVGVSVNPENGLEVIQVDFEQKRVVKYGRKDLDYDINTQEIVDLDYFKETLQELLYELNIPKGTELVLNVPTMMFRVMDYPTALTETQITDAILADLSENPAYKDTDLAVSVTEIGEPTLQSKSIASTIARKTSLVEIAMQIKELGYKVAAIDVSVNSTLNALLYNNSIDCSNNSIWLLMIVESNYCRVLAMQGNHYTDCFEEKVAIGEVLGEEENYKTAIDAVSPILNNIPSQYLFVVSKTNLISAEVLANKLDYKSTIIHCESNANAQTPLLETDESIPDDLAKTISIDVIGAGIRQYCKTGCNINLFNESLGMVFLAEKPLTLTIGNKRFVLSVENMIKVSVILSAIVLAICFMLFVVVKGTLHKKHNELSKLRETTENIKLELKANESISSDIFDEDSAIRVGLEQNKRIYSYYTIVGTEIPQKLWLTRLELNKDTTIEGQSDNLQSIYAFFRNIKDYDVTSDIKLQKLELASRSNSRFLSDENDSGALLSSITADFYQFKISNVAEPKTSEADAEQREDTDSKNSGQKNKNSKPPKFIPSSSLETAD